MQLISNFYFATHLHYKQTENPALLETLANERHCESELKGTLSNAVRIFGRERERERQKLVNDSYYTPICNSPAGMAVTHQPCRHFS